MPWLITEKPEKRMFFSAAVFDRMLILTLLVFINKTLCILFRLFTGQQVNNPG